ncbi:MAG: hypothetical protein HQL30_04480 [Candidatus Omnitrophica bacterium]|nr:hypothetical protein [Candidatus Omnitrophota bacterium]
MGKRSRDVAVSFVLAGIVIFCRPLTLEAAEVYYLGQGSTAGGAPDVNKTFTLEDRVDDLLDFKNYGNYGPDRSGMITGSVMEEINFNATGGNGTKTFLRRGVYQNTEVNINSYEKLISDYSFESQLFLRRTDDRRIERRKDLRVKQLTTQISNPDNMLLFGDFYGDFSQFTLGNSLEGFNAEIKEYDSVHLQGVAARSQSPDNDMSAFWRNVYGGKTDIFLFKEEGEEAFKTFRIGTQAVTNRDDRATSDSTGLGTPIPDMSNTVVSVDGEIATKEYFSLIYELGTSYHNLDERKAAYSDDKHGNAFRARPRLKYGPFTGTYLFYYVQPKFYTDAGSAMPDKMQHQGTLDYDITKKMRATVTENYYWNHLTGSTLKKRTIYDEKYMTLNMRPYESDPSFSVRAYTNVQERRSDDVFNTLRAVTYTPGVAVNDNLDDKTSYGIFGEFRGFIDKYVKSNSDYFYRLGTNLGREQYILKRRAYLSGYLNLDYHDPKKYPKEDFNTGVGFQGQYNIYGAHMLYFGYNVNSSDSNQPMQNYFNYTTFFEMNFLMEKKRSTRLVFRGEHNDYNQQDKEQSYDETRFITKLVSNF